MKANKGKKLNKTLLSYGKDIIKIYDEIKNACTTTEIRRLEWLKRINGFNVFAKFENQQKTGSFKFRGAYYRLKQFVDSPIIVASAGNHGLAVAEVSSILGIKTTICIPVNASNIKKQRLSAYNHSIVQQGSSLEESIEYARSLSVKFGWDFISPYNDFNLIQGQGTLAVEFLNQCENIDTLIVPVGGGGLVSGVGIAAKYINPSIKIIAAIPEKYQSFFLSLKSGKSKKVTNYPTFADGLAVNVEENSLTIDIGKKVIDDMILVSEEEIAAATLAILYHESQLVEPSGAVGFASIISGKLDSHNLGRVGLILTGGNITTSNLNRIMNYPFHNVKLFDFINRHGSKTDHQATMKGVNFSDAELKKQFSYAKDRSQKQDLNQDFAYWESRYEHIEKLVDLIKFRLKEYMNYCKVEYLRPDISAIRTARQLIDSIENDIRAKPFKKRIQFLNVEQYNKSITEQLQRYRAFLHKIMSASLVLDWRSASYGQSWDTMFFNLDSQGNPGVNYNRYESNQLSFVEKNLAEVLGINLESFSLLATSSGMAAYTLIESFLLRYVLQQNNKVYIPHYIYFETDEQISKIPHIDIFRTETHDVNEIVKNIIKHKPKVVFIDSLTNTIDLRITDIQKICDLLSKEFLDYDIFFVIDGSMMSGEIDLSFLIKNKSRIKILYYDSCSKYLQLGLDIAMGGLVVFPFNYQPVFDRLRRNTGTIMYDSVSNIFPIYTREVHQRRMRRFSENALLIGNMFLESQRLRKQVIPHFPLLKNHPDHLVALNHHSVGGLMTFSFPSNTYLNQRDSLNSFIEMALIIAKKFGVSLTKGVSFGFSIPRISAAAAMAENSPPFLRLSVGDRSYEETKLLGEALEQAFESYIKNAERMYDKER